MDVAEDCVHKYLLANGFSGIVHEPDGNVPPDFVINNSIAIEVTRLISHYQDLSGINETYAHQTHYPKVWQGLEQLLIEFGSAIDGESWYVDFSLVHPFKGWSNVKIMLGRYLLLLKTRIKKSIETIKFKSACRLVSFNAFQKMKIIILLVVEPIMKWAV